MPNQDIHTQSPAKTLYLLLALSLAVGILFPVLATILELKLRALEFNWVTIKELHKENPTLLVLDLASSFLFFLFLVLGIRQLQLDKTNEMMTLKSKELSRLLDETQNKNRELDQYAYIVTHDLKAPLRAATNLLTWINEDIQNTTNTETLTNINLLKQRLAYMDKLIVDVLEYSRAGKEQLTQEKVNTSELVQEIIQNLDIAHRFEINVQIDMPHIDAPRIYLQQIFMNLISNAAKYHNKKGGKIEVSFIQHAKHLEFSVSDDGPGIDPKYHTKVFGLFQKLNTNDNTDSTGIGLAIVKKIVAEVKGNIKLESSLNKGSKFTIEWPIKSAA